MKYENIVWDWNGTVLDDVDFCVEVIRSIQKKRGMTPLVTTRSYRRHFFFPVRDYYLKIGFDLETERFSDLVSEYVSLYLPDNEKKRLFFDLPPMLKEIKMSGRRQYLISASRQDTLIPQLVRFGIADMFDGIFGIADDRAEGKLEMARARVLENGIDPERTLFIGDTDHDFEVASQLGADCALISRGHQSKKRLMTVGCRVAPNIDALHSLIFKKRQPQKGRTKPPIPPPYSR